MIWTIEYWYRVYNGGGDAGVYVVDSIHFNEVAALKRRDELEEEHPDRSHWIRTYSEDTGSQFFLDFEPVY